MGYFASVDEARKRDFAKVYVQCMQALGSYWRGHLRPSDCNILQFIVDRTLRWGKTCEVITYSQMLHGVHTSDGQCVCSKVGLSRRTLFRAVARLEKDGFFSIARTRTTRSGHEANIFEINCKLILERDAMVLPSNKKPKNLPLCQNDTTLVPSGHYPLCQTDTAKIHKGKPTEVKSQKELPTAGAAGGRFGGIEEAVAAVKHRGSVLRAEKAARVNTGWTLHTVTALWQQTVLRYYPRVPAIGMSVKQFVIFKRMVNAQLKHVDMEAFFDWIVSHWVELRAGKLAWMNRKREMIPLTPSMDVLATYLRVFIKVYADESTVAAISEEKQKTPKLHRQLRQVERELEEQRKENERLRQAQARQEQEYEPLTRRKAY